MGLCWVGSFLRDVWNRERLGKGKPVVPKINLDSLNIFPRVHTFYVHSDYFPIARRKKHVLTLHKLIPNRSIRSVQKEWGGLAALVPLRAGASPHNGVTGTIWSRKPNCQIYGQSELSKNQSGGIQLSIGPCIVLWEI